MKQFDVAIIGGGIAGLVASIDLALAGKSVVLFEKSSQLVEQEFSDPMTRHIIYAMLRTNSYAQAIDHQLAGPALRSIARTTKKNSIVYIQDGWQTLVDQLFEKAVQSGVSMITGKNVTEIEHMCIRLG